MPDKCCVPGCKGNYKSETDTVSVFKIPNDEPLRSKWLKSIPRKDWTPGKRSVVCERHFDPLCISREECYQDKRDIEGCFSRKRPTLLPGAVPTLFPNVPKYLSTRACTPRVNPEARKQSVIQRHNKQVEEWLQSDIIVSFSELCKDFKDKICVSEWKIDQLDVMIVFYKVSLVNLPKVYVCVKVYSDLAIDVVKDDSLLDVSDLKWVLGDNKKLTRWSQLENLLARYSNEISTDKSLSTLVHNVKLHLERLKQHLKSGDENDETVLMNLEFVTEHISLLFADKHGQRYSPMFMLNAFLIYMQSAACYNAIRENVITTLPHPKTLQRLSSALCCEVSDPCENGRFLKSAASKLCEREKYVVLQVDEIFLKQSIEYKNGNISGFAVNDQSVTAKTLVAFMISSAYGNFKEIVALVAVSNVSGSELTGYTVDACKLTIACDFKVIVIISDNNRVNRLLFQNLSNSNALHNYECHLSNDYKTFLTYDTVHIFKNVRNNWLNQKDSEKTFIFPSFTEENKIEVARFSDLRELYRHEVNDLLKLAPKLNFKTVYPNTLERQKVSLVCNIFHETTLHAVRKKYGENSGTAQFIDIFLKWWTIMNVKNAVKHILHRNPLEAPFTCANDARLSFLEQFLLWLSKWKGLGYRNGMLTNDTYNAIVQNTTVMINFINYSLTEVQVNYVLPGKLQTDGLENRFSRYRQLCGGNYHVTVQAILEAEKKLRVKSVLGLHSARYGIVCFSFDALSEPKDIDQINNSCFENYDSFLDIEAVNVFEIVSVNDPALMYICGYAAFKIKQTLTCKLCEELIISQDKQVPNTYIDGLNRGGLTVPSVTVMTVGIHVYGIMQYLISEECESNFLGIPNQRMLLLNLCMKSLKNESLMSDLLNAVCVCGQAHVWIISKLIRYMSNVLLNNYCKMVNNFSAANTKKRKLQILL